MTILKLFFNPRRIRTNVNVETLLLIIHLSCRVLFHRSSLARIPPHARKQFIRRYVGASHPLARMRAVEFYYRTKGCR